MSLRRNKPLRRKSPLDSSAAARRYAEKRKRKALAEGTYSSLDAARQRAGAGEGRVTPTRRAEMKRSGPIQPKKRSAAEKARVYGSPDRIAWFKALPCAVPGCPVTEGCDLAHTETGGMGRKADAETCAPLCRYHHREQHDIGVPAFERRYSIDLSAIAAATEAAWREHNA